MKKEDLVKEYCEVVKRKSGEISMNGPSALKIKTGDLIIIMGFELTDKPIKPKIVLVDEKNRFSRYL